MTLVKRNHHQAPRFFDSFLLKDLLEWPQLETSSYRSHGNSFPAVNIKETDTQFEVELAAPGLKKENFVIQLEKNVLTISSKKEEQKEEQKENGKYAIKEFSFQSFSRSFTLPENKVETEKIEATYNEGVLRLILPKKEEKVEKVKKIKVS